MYIKKRGISKIMVVISFFKKCHHLVKDVNGNKVFLVASSWFAYTVNHNCISCAQAVHVPWSVHRKPQKSIWSISLSLHPTPVLENNVKFRLPLPELYPASPRCLQKSLCVFACVCVPNKSEWPCSSAVGIRQGLVRLKDSNDFEWIFFLDSL